MGEVTGGLGMKRYMMDVSGEDSNVVKYLIDS